MQSLTLVFHVEAEGAFLHGPVPDGAACDADASCTLGDFPSCPFSFLSLSKAWGTGGLQNPSLI